MSQVSIYQNQNQDRTGIALIIIKQKRLAIMMEKIKEMGEGILSVVKENPKIIAGALAISSLLLMGYSIRRKEHTKLYQLTSKHFETVNDGPLNGHGDQQPEQMRLEDEGIKYYENIIIHTVMGTSLRGWLIRANTKRRNPQRLIVYYHSQHTKIQDNLDYVKILSEYTVSDVLLIQYSLEPKARTEKSMKDDAVGIYERAVEIADREGKFLVVMGKDLGSLLAIHICSMERYRIMYRLKGLVVQNIFESISSHKARNINPGLAKNLAKMIFSTILVDRWETRDNMMKIRVPIMLLVDKILKHEEDIWLYSLYPGRKVVYEITSNDRLKEEKYRQSRIDKKARSQHQHQSDSSESSDSDDSSSGDDSSEGSELGSQEQDDKKWEQDIANYFMEIDIFMNSI